MNEKSTKGKSFEKRREPQVGQQLDNVCDDISDRDISYLITRMPITIQHFLGQLQQNHPNKPATEHGCRSNNVVF